MICARRESKPSREKLFKLTKPPGCREELLPFYQAWMRGWLCGYGEINTSEWEECGNVPKYVTFKTAEIKPM